MCQHLSRDVHESFSILGSTHEAEITTLIADSFINISLTLTALNLHNDFMLEHRIFPQIVKQSDKFYKIQGQKGIKKI